MLPEFNSKWPVHLYGPLTPSIVGVALQDQVALSFMDHPSTLWKTQKVNFENIDLGSYFSCFNYCFEEPLSNALLSIKTTVIAFRLSKSLQRAYKQHK